MDDNIQNLINKIINIDKDLIVPTDKNLIIEKIGNDKILLKDIFPAIMCNHQTNDKYQDKPGINISTIRINNGNFCPIKPIDTSLVDKLIKALFNIVWKKYKSQEGKYDIEYVFKHWILITMNLAFKKDGWDINGWFYKITNKNFELPLDD